MCVGEEGYFVNRQAPYGREGLNEFGRDQCAVHKNKKQSEFCLLARKCCAV